MNQRSFVWTMVLITLVAALIMIFVVPTVSEFLFQWQQQFQAHTQVK